MPYEINHNCRTLFVAAQGEMHISFRKLIFSDGNVSKSANSELSDKKIPGEKFPKLMEKFTFYLNPVHFFILFFDFKVRLKWGKSKIQK